MTTMQKKRRKNLFGNCKGFSLLEVLLGITVFMIGMLGVTALNISSLKSNTFSGNLLEDDTGDGTGQDDNNNGIDDDSPEDTTYAGPGHDTETDFGLEDVGSPGDPDPADHEDPGLGRNGMYDVYWNIAEGEPFDICKRINVIVTWSVKDVPRQININTTRCMEL
jgi:hypothetical protein